MEKLGTGAFDSPKDKRTVKHKDLAQAVALVTGGNDYLPTDILHQHKVGICTGISRVQLRQKQTGKRYSYDFQYLLQKRFYDFNWTEGSSVFYAMKVAKNYGFLPADLWTHTTEADLSLPYSEYIKKLQAISESEIQRLIGLCVDKIAGYAEVNVSDPQAIAVAVSNSPDGILCRYDCGASWYTPSWLPKDINPLRKPNPITSGHAIILNKFDYTNGLMQKLSNTWGQLWNLQGCADVNYSDYSMTEAWVDLPTNPMFKFNNDMGYGSRIPDVLELQKRLNMPSMFCTGYFGLITQGYVIKYQLQKGITPAKGYVGPITRNVLNS